jgi:peptide/nickel transport system substrate-binding protein
LKFPSFNQWKQILKVLTKKEKIILTFLFILFFGSFSFLSINFYLKNTEIQPKPGGDYTEGLIGQPRFLNPIYAQTNDVDRDLVELLFSGLVKYDTDGKIIPDLAEKYEIKEQGRVYEFTLKENILWQDGKPLTADDVIFTIETIQNSDYKSPVRANFLGVTVEKISDLGVRFSLKNPYLPFLERTTVKILPKHIWEEIPPDSFPLTTFNLQPIGSGPYKIKKVEKNNSDKIKSLVLERNPNYFAQKPNISKITFLFFDNDKQLIAAAQGKKIKGFSLISSQSLKTEFKNYNIILPRYFALFFNSQKSKILKEKKVREALNYGTNKQEIIKNLFGEDQSFAQIVQSPILPQVYGFQPPASKYEFDIEKAKDLLEKAGFKDKNGKREKVIKKKQAFQFESNLKKGSQGTEVKELQKCLAQDPEVYPEADITGWFGSLTQKAVIRFQEKYSKDILEPWGFKQGTGLVSKTTRAKLNEICFESPEEILPLKFSLVVPEQAQLVECANLLKKQWQELGVEIKIETKNPSQLEKEVIKPRDYEMFLFGQLLASIPDPFPFWHSSQKRDPGLNLALYENKNADKLLEKARESQDFQNLTENLEKFQNILIEDAPVVFLYSPDYIYLVSKEIKGINLKMITEPSKRFSQIENWYIKTKRAWKLW